MQSIENFLISSDKDLDEIKKLRLLYYERTIELEKLWIDFEENHIDELKAKGRLFKIMDGSKKIEDLDSSINIKSIRKLNKKAENEVNIYSQKLTRHE